MSIRFTKIMVILMASIIGIIAMAGCSPAATTTASFSVTDMAGRTVTFNSPVKNALVLYGPGYEKISMLGAENLIVACADYHKTHAAWAHVIYKKLDSLPAVSNPSAPNMETLLGYKPDVVFWFGNDDNVKAMENAGLKVICSVSSNTSLESLKKVLNVYAQVLGGDALKKSEEYNKIFDKIMQNVTSVTSKIAETDKPKVYVSMGNPLRAWGGKSMIRNTVEKAGGIFVASDVLQGTNAMINYEQILQWNPDIIIIDHAQDLPDPSVGSTSNIFRASAVYDQIMSDPQLQAINAVKNKQVYISPTGTFFWDAGEQTILQLEWMSKIFHPDLFKSLDMQKELKDFYSEFFSYKLTDEQATMILAHQLPPGAEKWGY
jgi:iron complex transport system substrate-binding protein